MTQQAMTFAEYVQLAQVTANKNMTEQERWPVTLAGLAGELGEIFDLIKKEMGHGHPRNHEKLVAECGDFFWYLAESAVYLKLSIPDNWLDHNKFISTMPVYTQLWRVLANLTGFAGCFDATWHPAYNEFTKEGPYFLSNAQTEFESLFKSYVCLINSMPLDIQEVLQANISKLKARYPEGFTHQASLNRKD